MCIPTSPLFPGGGSVLYAEIRLQQSNLLIAAAFYVFLEGIYFDVQTTQAKASPDENL